MPEIFSHGNWGDETYGWSNSNTVSGSSTATYADEFGITHTNTGSLDPARQSRMMATMRSGCVLVPDASAAIQCLGAGIGTYRTRLCNLALSLWIFPYSYCRERRPIEAM